MKGNVLKRQGMFWWRTGNVPGRGLKCFGREQEIFRLETGNVLAGDRQCSSKGNVLMGGSKSSRRRKEYPVGERGMGSRKWPTTPCICSDGKNYATRCKLKHFPEKKWRTCFCRSEIHGGQGERGRRRARGRGQGGQHREGNNDDLQCPVNVKFLHPLTRLTQKGRRDLKKLFSLHDTPN